MKSYNNLWNSYISDENIELAIKNAARGKRDRPSVKKKLDNPNFKNEIRDYAIHFKNKPHKPKEIYDGIKRKKRTIIVPSFEEQVIHHMVVNVLKPIFEKPMYYHSYGSIPGKGAHRGKKAIEKWIQNNGKDSKYVLKMDIQKYFDSIPHDILFARLRQLIRDDKFFSVVEEIIKVEDCGIPLGFYTSQWIANWYLTGLDHFIKEELKAKFYIRYMDDMVIFDSNKKHLHKARESIDKYLKENLGLKLKGNWQVFRFEYRGRYRPLDFMGFLFYRNRTTLRKSIMLKASRKAKRLSKKRITVYDCRQMMAYLGWIDCTDTYGYYLEYIKPFVNFKRLKVHIGKYDKAKEKRDGVVQKQIIRTA